MDESARLYDSQGDEVATIGWDGEVRLSNGTVVGNAGGFGGGEIIYGPPHRGGRGSPIGRVDHGGVIGRFRGDDLETIGHVSGTEVRLGDARIGRVDAKADTQVGNGVTDAHRAAAALLLLVVPPDKTAAVARSSASAGSAPGLPGVDRPPAPARSRPLLLKLTVASIPIWWFFGNRMNQSSYHRYPDAGHRTLDQVRGLVVYVGVACLVVCLGAIASLIEIHRHPYRTKGRMLAGLLVVVAGFYAGVCFGMLTGIIDTP